jgi:hypothetical protein
MQLLIKEAILRFFHRAVGYTMFIRLPGANLIPPRKKNKVYDD